MGLELNRLRSSLDAVARVEPAIAEALAVAGYPEPRSAPRGYRALLRTIVGQQVSTASAAAVWGRMEATFGADMPLAPIVSADFDTMRACGLSRQKQAYVRSLCDLVLSEELELDHLPQDDETAIAELQRIKGIGRWSAEIYLLFAEGRPDIWPAGDLGVQAGLHRILGLDARPGEKAARALAEPWRPHRGAMAIFSWHCINNATL